MVAVTLACFYLLLMVNNYKRKTTQRSWDEETMRRAMEEAAKTSVSGAAKKYGINLSTLQRHVKNGSAKNKLLTKINY